MVEAIVEFDYKAQEKDELSIRKGDKITDVKTLTGGWWEGLLAGKRGMFPDNFVKLITKQESGNSMKGSSNDVTMRAGGGRRCKVLYSYQPANEDELQLTVDDIIDVIAEVEDGWWKGSLRDMVGVFPSNFVTEIVGEEPRRPRPGSRDEALRVADSESDCDRSTSVSSPDSSQLLDVSVTRSDLDADVPSLPPKPLKEQCRVLFAYEAANGDELTLREGDLVTLLSREVQDKGWWRGELRGRTGLFPDNFVEVLPPAAQPEEPPKKPDRLAAKLPQVTTNRARDSITKPPTKNEASPPVPGKKPQISLPGGKPSDRVAVVGPFDDVTDGAAPSRASRSIDAPSPAPASDFDNVARAAMLTHPTAGRVRAPSRRPPTILPPKETSTPQVEAAEVSASSTGGGSSLTNGTSMENVSHADEHNAAPGKKSWEKVKAPWMEELKMNQARKTISPEGTPTTASKPVSIRTSRPQSMYSGEPTRGTTGTSPSKPSFAVAPPPPTKVTRLNNHHPPSKTAGVEAAHGDGVGNNHTAEGGSNGSTAAHVTKSHSFRSTVTSASDASLHRHKHDGAAQGDADLRQAVAKLQAALELQRETFARALKEMAQKLEEEASKRVLLEQQLNKLTDLVTQV